jgi:hypothetical protein
MQCLFTRTVIFGALRAVLENRKARQCLECHEEHYRFCSSREFPKNIRKLPVRTGI